MNINSHRDDEREQLLAGRSLSDLNAAESNDLDGSLTAADLEALHELERTVTALDLAMDRTREQKLPTSMRLSILREADAFFSGQSSSKSVSLSNRPNESAAETGAVELTAAPKTWRRREALAWMTTAAATTFAVGSWWWQTAPRSSISNLSLARTDLLASAKDLIQVEWKAGKTPLQESVSGDVVWSSSYQKGFMRLIGLPINDPLQEQYQLWIIDPLRDDEPVDGGVFDISQPGEVIVPIQAKLRVTKPAAFAITIEKPGGVVVSKQERLPLLAVVP